MYFHKTTGSNCSPWAQGSLFWCLECCSASVSGCYDTTTVKYWERGVTNQKNSVFGWYVLVAVLILHISMSSEFFSLVWVSKFAVGWAWQWRLKKKCWRRDLMGGWYQLRREWNKFGRHRQSHRRRPALTVGCWNCWLHVSVWFYNRHKCHSSLCSLLPRAWLDLFFIFISEF